MANPQAVLSVHNVRKSFFSDSGENEVLADVSFSLFSGEVLALVGPSGCGKSTLLNIIAGLDTDFHGKISYGGSAGTPHKMGYIFQQDALLPWRRAWDNALLGAEVNGGIRPNHIETAAQLMSLFGLAGFEKHYPSQLSGGMRQRLAIIQSLVMDPHLLLLDEPFSAVDYYNKLTLEDILHRFLKEKNKAAILVTHDLDEAVALADRILLYSPAPSRVIKEIFVDFGLERSQLPPSLARGQSRFSDYHAMLWQKIKGNVA